MDIAQAYIQIMPTTEGIGSALQDALAPAADDAADAAGKSAGSKLVGALGGAAKIGAAALGAVATATAATGAALAGAAGNVASYGDNIDKMSQKLGISATAYQEWDAVLQHSGTSIDTLKAGMRTLSGELSGAAEVINETAAADAELEARLESGAISLDEYNKQYDALYESAYQNVGVLGELGFSLQDIADMSQDSDLALEKVISALQEMPEGAERTALAQQLLGRSSMELGALLNTSAEDTKAMRDRVHELGGVMSDDAVKASAAYQDSLQDMQTSMAGVKNNLIADFLPGMTAVMDGVADLFMGGDGDAIGEGLDSIIGAVTEKIPEVAEAGSSIVEAVSGAIAANLPSLLDAGLQILLMVMSGLIDNLPMLLDGGLQAILSLSDGISQSLPELIPALVDTVMTIVQGLIDRAPELIAAALQIMLALGMGLINAIPNVIQRIPQIIISIVQALLAAIPQIITTGVQLLSSLVTNLPQALASILSGVAQIGTGILSAIAGFVPQMISAGANLLAGLGQGIINGVSGVISKAKEAAGNVLGAIKGFFGIASPAKVMIPLGEFLDAGFGIGITRGIPALVKSASSAASAVLDAVRPDGPVEISADDIVAITGDLPEPGEIGMRTARAARAVSRSSAEPEMGVASDRIDDLIGLLRLILRAIDDKQLVIDRRSLSDWVLGEVDRRVGRAAWQQAREVYV